MREKKKRVALTVPAEEYESLRAMGKKAGFPDHWISDQFGTVIKVLHAVAEKAVKDAEEKRQMSEEEAKKRYEEIARQAVEKLL